jgi:methionyl aminopeptidase
MSIVIKTPEDIAGMRVACRLASEVLDMLTPLIKPGVSTLELDKIATHYIQEVQGTISATIGYAPPGYPPFPAALCTSVNHVVCHGIPNDRPLKNGDILNIDVTVIKDGWHGDNSRMYIVGEGSIAAKRLCQFTFEAMWKGIEKVRPGARLGDIGHAIQGYVEPAGFSVVREFCAMRGPQVPREPQVLHYGRPGTLGGVGAGHGVHHRAHDQRRPARDQGTCPTAGPSSPRTARCRRSGSTPSPSPIPATRC